MLRLGGYSGSPAPFDPDTVTRMIATCSDFNITTTSAAATAAAAAAAKTGGVADDMVVVGDDDYDAVVGLCVQVSQVNTPSTAWLQSIFAHSSHITLTECNLRPHHFTAITDFLQQQQQQQQRRRHIPVVSFSLINNQMTPCLLELQANGYSSLEETSFGQFILQLFQLPNLITIELSQHWCFPFVKSDTTGNIDKTEILYLLTLLKSAYRCRYACGLPIVKNLKLFGWDAVAAFEIQELRDYVTELYVSDACGGGGGDGDVIL